MIGIAVIGAGGRGRSIVGNLLRDSDRQVKVVSIFDPDRSQAEGARDDWGATEARLCDAYADAIDAAGVQWVLVASPNAFHREHILAAFKAGKHVFTEKPLATTIADCQAIYDAHQQSDLMFATGFVLRYAPIYRRVKELLEAGTIGRLLSIDANENITPAHGAYIMSNWRRKTDLAGPHVLEKCVHDIDLLNWFIGALPRRIAAFGGRDFFVPANRHLEPFVDAARFRPHDPHRTETPFTDDADLMDNLVSILEYRNHVRVQFQATMSNAIPERRMYFSGTEGTMIAELYSSSLCYQRIDQNDPVAISFKADGHGGGDGCIMKELFETMVSGAPPKCSGDEGLESAVVALAIDQAAREGELVNLEPVWERLGR